MNIEIISASAGSGKTYRLAELLEQLVRDNRVRPDAILATTFTRKAAAELQERVRTKLLAAELATQAQQLSVSRIGTVNSVCGELLTDFAFDLGISPGQKVIEEEAVSGVINRALSRVIDKTVSKELWRLKQVIPGLKSRKIIESIIAKARANDLGGKELIKCGQKSVEEFLVLLGDPVTDGAMLDQALVDGMERFLHTVDTEIDSTQVTNTAIEKVRQLKRRFDNHKYLCWSDWHRLARLRTGIKSKETAEPLRLAAACHDNHPRLHKDVTRLITLVFMLAAKTLEAYREYKREWGVVDFTDQEALTLKLLNMEQPARILSEQLDLVLVDEFQDTSPIQLAIFLKLASFAKKSVWVGDQKQAIYGFRDADPSLMDAAISGILKGEEPETLQYSWRSRPELVSSTSDIFVKAFASQGFPERRVRLEPAAGVLQKAPSGLGPVYEYWQLESTNKDNDALALASSVRDFLADPGNTIRDPKIGSKRRARGGDVAILCRKNDDCTAVAEALEQQGVGAALPRDGLLSCPEIIVTLAGVRLLIDSRDSLARAEIARLLDDPDNHDAWLEKALEKPFAQRFELEIFSRIEEEKELLSMGGPLEVLDAAMEATSVRLHCLAWGDSEARLANLDSLRALCVRYLEECKASGMGASPVGMLVYLDSLKSVDRAVVQNEDTVQVLTWHKAKGLEWPVTVLFQLEKVFKPTPLGVNVVSEGEFMLESPLKNRWLRYWPDPYAIKSKYNTHSIGAPFHERLEDSSAFLEQTEKEVRQELRLLYVGWTRARDKVVLAGRAGFLQKGILRLLVDEEESPLLEPPKGESAIWADRKVELVCRTGKPAEPLERKSQPGSGHLPGIRKEYPPAFEAASTVLGQGTVSSLEKIGKRISLAGEPDMQALGEAIHTFLAADNVERDAAKRFAMATRILTRWEADANMSPESLLLASERLHNWISSKWPKGVLRREYPVSLLQENGSIVSGIIDLLIETPDGFVIVDHKSFPGNLEETKKKAAGFAGQLGVYAEAVEIATGRDVIGCYLHFPVGAIMLQI